ncbi:MAG: guanylate kinase [Armatimonadota bacterium]|nr:guanylate kinase [Armatimonadota bacterium]
MTAGQAQAAGRGILLVVAGPSGVGKGTLIAGLRERHPHIEWSVSCTTRRPRPGEVPGHDYHFIGEDEFRRMMREGELLEWAVVHGTDLYGTPRAPVEEALAAGRDMVVEIDYQGARSLREALPEAVLVFVAPPDLAALCERLEGRNTESEGAVRRRLHSARTEFRHMGMFEYVIVNDELQPAIEALVAIYEAERQRISRANWRALQARLLADLPDLEG